MRPSSIRRRSAGGPIPCRHYTGFAGGESRIEVAPDGTVFFSPAPFLRGALSLGYTPDEEPTGFQWMFQQGGIAVSRDSGESWRYVEPSDATYTMDDAHSFLDRETGRYFWNVLNQSPETEDPPNSPTAAVPLLEGQVLSTPDGGASWTHATAFGPVDDRPELLTGRAPAGQPAPTGYSNVVYHCSMYSGDGVCSRSLDLGAPPIGAIMGSRSLFLLAGEAHRSSRRLLSPALHGDCLRALGPIIRDTALRTISTWDPGQPFSMLESMRALRRREVPAGPAPARLCKSGKGPGPRRASQIARRAPGHWTAIGPGVPMVCVISQGSR